MKILNQNRSVEIAWQSLLALYCVSVFTSKSGLSIFGLILIIMSLFFISWADLYKNRKELLAFVGLYPLGVLLSFFSLGGAESALKLAYSWPWPLLALPAYVVFERKKDHKVALIASLVGLGIACGYSLLMFVRGFDPQTVGMGRIASFWDISRWGVFLSSALMGLLPLTLYFKGRGLKREALLMQVFVVVVAVCLVLSNTRGPWLAAIAGSTFFSILYPRILKFLAVLLVMIVLMFSASPNLRGRIISMVNVQQATDGKMTSTDPSNEGRLYMWQVNSEFFLQQPWFGTGFKNTEQHLTQFIDSRPGYREKYVTSEFSFTDQHSSYFTMLVQMGAVFFVVFWSVYLWLLGNLGKAWYRSRSLWAGGVICLMLVHCVVSVFYSSVVSYEMTALFPFIALWPKKH